MFVISEADRSLSEALGDEISEVQLGNDFRDWSDLGTRRGAWGRRSIREILGRI